MGRDNEHREILDCGINIFYWKGNTACGSKDHWTKATISIGPSGFAHEFETSDLREIEQITAICRGVFAKGREFQAAVIRHALGVGEGFGDSKLVKVPVGSKS